MLIKQRTGRVNPKRLCIQDSTLLKTRFLPLTPFRVIVNRRSRQLLIVTAADCTGNTVSARERRHGVAPVIDIRNREWLDALSGSDYLQIAIYEDRIVVDGFPARGSDDSSDLPRPQRISVTVAASQLRQAVGDTEGRSVVQIIDRMASQYAVTPATPLLRQYQEQVRFALKAVSLFTGAGLFDIGLILAGFEVVFALEIDPHAVETYRANIGPHVVQADITTYDKRQVPHVPVIFGGPPCQGFSSLNNRRSADYHTNRLLDDYLEVVSLNPACKVAIIENVRNFQRMSNGAFIRRIENALPDFDLTVGVLDARDYGSPQHRERTIALLSRIGRIELPAPTRTPGNYRTVGEALAGLTDAVPNQQDYSQNEPLTVERLRHIPPGGNWRCLPPHLREGLNAHTYAHKYYRLDPDQPSITLMNLNKAHIAPPSGNRFLSVREGARLFGVPDRFVFHGELRAQQTQVGNGVAVHMAYQIGRAVREALERHTMQTCLGWAP